MSVTVTLPATPAVMVVGKPESSTLEAAADFTVMLDREAAREPFAVSVAVSDWLPVLFGVMLILMVWIMWRMLKMMPSVKPAEVNTRSKAAVTWADVAGVDVGLVRRSWARLAPHVMNGRRVTPDVGKIRHHRLADQRV